jgi:hypothetical protein
VHVNLRRSARAAALALIVAVTAGCSVSLRTESQPSQACMDALIGGTLTLDPRSGLGIADEAGVVTPVVWPFGYSARRELSKIALLDATGKVVAHEGDRVQLGGGLGNGDFWYACGSGLIAPALQAP